MTVELISVGTEILMGNIVNTNANYLSRKCAELGLSLYFQITVGDNDERVCEVIRSAVNRSDIVILTGGLGPTGDDMTKEAVAKVFGRKLIMDETSRKRIQSYFEFRNKNITDMDGKPAIPAVITENNWKQALAIEGSIIVENDNGTAPGYIVEADDRMEIPKTAKEATKRVILLPGPPNEMVPMFDHHILPYLRKLQNKVFLSDMVKICGIGESKAETQILDLINGQTNPTIAPYAKNGEVHFRVTASAADEKEAHQLLKPVIDELFSRFGDNIYTTKEEETLEEVVVKLLLKNKMTVTCAESCTGGLLAGRIVNVPGASAVLNESFITYANEAKMKYLGVHEDTLRQYGAVSEQTAREMAEGAARAAGSEAAIAVTGIAGPDGGTGQKPVGLVYIGCYVKGRVTVREYRMKGSRDKIRDQSVICALDLLRRTIKIL